MKALFYGLICAVAIFSLSKRILAIDQEPESKPSFALIMWEGSNAKILKQGVFSQENFRHLFLKPYALKGERLHPKGRRDVIGMLIAHEKTAAPAVPIYKWEGTDGVPIFLCQGSDDGSPPAFTVLSHSQKELVNEIEKALTEDHNPVK